MQEWNTRLHMEVVDTNFPINIDNKDPYRLHWLVLILNCNGSLPEKKIEQKIPLCTYHVPHLAHTHETAHSLSDFCTVQMSSVWLSAHLGYFHDYLLFVYTMPPVTPFTNMVWL